MKRALAGIFLTLFSLEAVAADPELIRPPFPGSSPWKLVTDQPDLKEWIPENQSADDAQDFWRQKTFRRQDKPLQAADIFRDAFSALQARCDQLGVSSRREQTVNDITTAYVEARCLKPKDPTKNFDVIMKALGNGDAVYLVEREFRKPRPAGSLAPEIAGRPLPPSLTSEAILELMPLSMVTSYFPRVRIAPVLTEKLVVPAYPTGNWKILMDSGTDEATLVERIPVEQTAQTISDLLQEHVLFSDAARKMPPKTFVTATFTRFNRQCSAMNVNGPTEATEDGHAVAYGEVFCKNSRSPAGKDIDIFLKVIQGKDALYMVQRDFHRPTEPGTGAGERRYRPDQADQMKADNAAIETAQGFLKQVRLCPASDAACLAPVPSP
jgi:hypothetical protein